VSHLAILPILLPALSGILMLLPPLAARPLAQRWIAWIGLAALMVTAGVLLHLVTYQTQIYVLGDWQPPFGIMLLVDRLAALLLTATAVLAFCACLYGEARGIDRDIFSTRSLCSRLWASMVPF
jgi:multicomponent K+:H+ antiporter subunit D